MAELLTSVLRRDPGAVLSLDALCEAPPPEGVRRQEGEFIDALVDAGPTWAEEARGVSAAARNRFVAWLAQAGEGAEFREFLDSETAAGSLTALVDYGALQHGVLGPALGPGLGEPRMGLIPKEGETRHRLDDGRTLVLSRLETRMVDDE